MSESTTTPIKVIEVYPDGMTREEFEEALLVQVEYIAALLIRFCPEYFIVEEEELEVAA